MQARPFFLEELVMVYRLLLVQGNIFREQYLKATNLTREMEKLIHSETMGFAEGRPRSLFPSYARFTCVSIKVK